MEVARGLPPQLPVNHLFYTGEEYCGKRSAFVAGQLGKAQPPKSRSHPKKTWWLKTLRGTSCPSWFKLLFRLSLLLQPALLFSNAVDDHADRNPKIILLFPEISGLEVIRLYPQREALIDFVIRAGASR